MSDLLAGKVALVTGAGRGVGRAHALHLAELGAKVVVNDLGVAADGSDSATHPAETVCQEIRATGGEAITNFADVSDEADAAEMIRSTVDTFGRLDVLVCNAGIVRDKMSYNLSVEDWDQVARVNVRGHFLPAREAARYWRELAKASGEGVNASVVLTSSRAAISGNPGQLNYAAGKSAIATMAVVMSRELARFGIRVNAICPRARTRMTENLAAYAAPKGDGFDLKAAENNSPMVGYLASDLSLEVTGQMFVVGEDNILWMRPWVEQGQLHKPGAPFDPREIHELSAQLFGGLPTAPASVHA